MTWMQFSLIGMSLLVALGLSLLQISDRYQSDGISGMAHQTSRMRTPASISMKNSVLSRSSNPFLSAQSISLNKVLRQKDPSFQLDSEWIRFIGKGNIVSLTDDAHGSKILFFSNNRSELIQILPSTKTFTANFKDGSNKTIHLIRSQ